MPESPGFTLLSTVKVRTVLLCTLLSFVTVFDYDLDLTGHEAIEYAVVHNHLRKRFDEGINTFG